MKTKERTRQDEIKVSLNTVGGQLYKATLAVGAGFEWVGSGKTEQEAVRNLKRNARIA